jgi:hypothetical protein
MHLESVRFATTAEVANVGLSIKLISITRVVVVIKKLDVWH